MILRPRRALRRRRLVIISDSSVSSFTRSHAQLHETLHKMKPTVTFPRFSFIPLTAEIMMTTLRLLLCFISIISVISDNPSSPKSSVWDFCSVTSCFILKSLSFGQYCFHPLSVVPHLCSERCSAKEVFHFDPSVLSAAVCLFLR